MSDVWVKEWVTDDYAEFKKKNFEVLDNFLNFAPTNILDIGCGLALESEMFQQKYNSNLYLLDSDFDNTKDRKRAVQYGDVDSFKFYSKLDDLKASYDSRNMNYTFIDANNINIDSNIKFDLIYSILSCGFHYPASTYKDLVKAHSHKNTVVLFDIRKKSFEEQKSEFKSIEIVHRGRKHYTCLIEFG